MIVGGTGTTARACAAFLVADMGHLGLSPREARRVVKRMRQQTGERKVLLTCCDGCLC